MIRTQGERREETSKRSPHLRHNPDIPIDTNASYAYTHTIKDYLALSPCFTVLSNCNLYEFSSIKSPPNAILTLMLSLDRVRGLRELHFHQLSTFPVHMPSKKPMYSVTTSIHYPIQSRTADNSKCSSRDEELEKGTSHFPLFPSKSYNTRITIKAIMKWQLTWKKKCHGNNEKRYLYSCSVTSSLIFRPL